MTSIAPVSGSGAASSATVTSQITALRKQEAVLTQKLKDVASSSADEKTEKTQSDLLTAQIQMIEAQIARLEQQQALDRAQKVEASNKATDTTKPTAPQRSLDGAGTRVDLEA